MAIAFISRSAKHLWGFWKTASRSLDLFDFGNAALTVINLAVAFATRLWDPWSATYAPAFALAKIGVGVSIAFCAAGWLGWGYSTIISAKPDSPSARRCRKMGLLFTCCILGLGLIYAERITRWADATFRKIDTIMVVADAPDKVASDSVRALEQALLQDARVKLEYSTVSTAPAAQGGHSALDTFRSNQGLRAAIWVHAQQMAPSGTEVGLDIEETPALPGRGFRGRATYERVPFDDAQAMVGITIVEYVSRLRYMQQDYGAVLRLANDWGRNQSRLWAALPQDHPTYLCVLLRSANALQEKAPLSCDRVKLTEAVAQAWAAREGFPAEQAFFGLVYAQLLVESGQFDEAERVLQSLQASHMDAADAGEMYRLLGEISLARAQLQASEPRETSLVRAVERFAVAVQRAPGSPQSHFGLGRACLLRALAGPSAETAPDLARAVRSLEAAQGLRPPVCLSRNVLMWLSVAHAVGGDATASQKALKEAQACQCASSDSLINLDTPLVLSQADATAAGWQLPVRLALPAEAADYQVRIMGGEQSAPQSTPVAVESMLTASQGLVYAASVDIHDLFNRPFVIRHLESSRQLQAQGSYELAVFQEPADVRVPPTFPLLLLARPELTISGVPAEPLTMQPDSAATIGAWVERPFPSGAGADVLKDNEILSGLQFLIRDISAKDVPDIVMERSPSTGHYTASIRPRRLGEQTLQVLVEEKGAKAGSRVLLASAPFSIRTVAPPPPTPTPPVTEVEVAVASDLYAEPKLAARLEAPFSAGDCPVVWVQATEKAADGSEWCRLLLRKGDFQRQCWAPSASLMVRRTLPYEALDTLAVTLAETKIYPEVDAQTPAGTVPKGALLEVKKQTEGRLLVRAHLPGPNDPFMEGWLPLRSNASDTLPLCGAR
ncbi:MAG TPA: hypothetical protein PLJ35_02495 [Anaerolineae bacterium]|nr:hypothetical protein [Anaerolineae bacterium]HOQ97673.1 hypothetical protein [Anaerolineae bacterium]HPL26605.1 hypothetical protein [Anaerolineae bacterium]